MARVLFAFLLTFFVAGCAATGPKFSDASAPNGKAIVYVYRIQHGWAYSGASSDFYIDGKNVFGLPSGGYSYFYLSPGSHELTRKWPIFVDPFSATQKISLDIKAGETRYVRFLVSAPGFWSTTSAADANWDFKEIPPNEARAELSQEAFQPQNPKTGYDF